MSIRNIETRIKVLQKNENKMETLASLAESLKRSISLSLSLSSFLSFLRPFMCSSTVGGNDSAFLSGYRFVAFRLDKTFG